MDSMLLWFNEKAVLVVVGIFVSNKEVKTVSNRVTESTGGLIPVCVNWFSCGQFLPWPRTMLSAFDSLACLVLIKALYTGIVFISRRENEGFE